MQIVFFGSAAFAVPSLKALHDSLHEIQLVVTQPDRRAGRGRRLQLTAVKATAEELGLSILQPEHVGAANVVAQLAGVSADLYVVVAYGQLLSRDVLSIPPAGAINVHASLLPKYRGAAPVAKAIRDGDRETGISIIQMVEALDAGPIVRQHVVSIEPEETSGSLTDRLAVIGADVLLQAVEDIAHNKVRPQPQQESLVTWAPRLCKADGTIDWTQPARTIHDHVRSVIPWPGAQTQWGQQRLKLWRVSVVACDTDDRPGSIVATDTKDELVVATGEGCLRIEELQIAGAERQLAANFLQGHPLSPGECLG